MSRPESETTQALILNEKTAFSWPVAVVVAVCLLATGGGMARMELLQRDLDLMRAKVELLEHQQGADRGQLHEQRATLAQVLSTLLELKGDVREALRGGVRPAGYSK
jgi:outer membrane murein-binding lipoprotein Lpp